VWGLDIVDPLRKAPGGYTHLLVAVNKFSKWIEARPITNLRVEQAVSFFTDIIHRFGVPNSIITNNGSEFTSRKFLEFCDKHHIRVDWTVVAHPQTNGQVERANDMILQGLKPRIFDRLNVWPKMAPGVVVGRLEPQDHPEQSHEIHPVLPSLWYGGRSPHGLGIRAAQS
jgi:transposase InsO family protein